MPNGSSLDLAAIVIGLVGGEIGVSRGLHFFFLKGKVCRNAGHNFLDTLGNSL